MNGCDPIRKLKLVIIMVLCYVLLTSCSLYTNKSSEINYGETDNAPELNDRIIIAGIYKDGSKSWFISEGLSAENEAKRLGADEFIYIDVKMDNDIYMQALDSIIDEKVDGVIICIPDQDLSTYTIKKLEEAGIPCIATNDPLVNAKGEIIAPFVGVDDYTLGNMTGDWMANYAMKNGLIDDQSMAVVIFQSEDILGNQIRSEGQEARFFEMLPYFGKDRLLIANYNGGTKESFEAATELFSQNRQIEKWLIMTEEDEGALGVIRALEQMGLDASSTVISIGGSLAMDEFKREYSPLKASAYYAHEKIGRESAQLLMNYIVDGDEISYSNIFNAVIITKENYQEVTGVE